MKNLVIIIMFMTFLSCKKEDEALYDSNGVATKLSHLWNTSITDDGEITPVVLGIGITDVNGNVLVGGGNKKGDRKILKLNPENGNILWSWDDIQSLKLDPNTKDPIYIDREAYYINQNKMYFNYGSSSYCVNLDNGSIKQTLIILVSTLELIVIIFQVISIILKIMTKNYSSEALNLIKKKRCY